ncbi:hypothetical protein ANTRET_LOCUS10468 [Anthophora retusa]
MSWNRCGGFILQLDASREEGRRIEGITKAEEAAAALRQVLRANRERLRVPRIKAARDLLREFQMNKYQCFITCVSLW